MLTGLFLPVALLATLLLPIYIFVFLSLLIIYSAQSDALLSAVFEISYIQSVFEQAFTYWLEHYEQVDHLTYSLPIILLPLIGVGLALFLTYRLGSWVTHYFRMNL